MFSVGDCSEKGDTCEIAESSKNFQESRAQGKQDILKHNCSLT